MTNNTMKKLMISAVAMAAAMGSVVAADIPENIWEYTEEQGKALITMDFEEVRIFLPLEWGGLYGFEIEEDHVEFYQEVSREIAEEEGMEGGGVLFTLCYAQDYEFTEYLPNYHIIGNGLEGVYYITVPTDVQCLGDDQETWDEWLMLIDGVQGVIESAVITQPGEGTPVNANFVEEDEYILPDSDTVLLKEEDIKDLTADEAQMAINEIYARHGRKFLWESVREYFEGKSWYEGTIEADEFDPATMSYLEWQNITLLIEHIKKLNTPVTEEKPEEPVKPEGIKITEGTEVVTTVYLNLRERTSTADPALLVIPKGDTLTARGEAENGWLPVAYTTEEDKPVWGFVWVEYVLPVTVIE